jgi:C4-dicarboxylate-specific signal transduction histidine kinase
VNDIPARTLANALAAAGEGVVLLADGQVVFWNRSARRLLGARGVRTPMPLTDLDPGAAAALIDGDLSMLMASVPPVRIRELDGGFTAVFLPPGPAERPQLQRLLEAEQRAVVGQVSGAVAREIGAPLLAIQAAADRIKRLSLDGDERAQESIGVILDQSHRIARLARRLIDLAEPGRARITEVDAASLVGEVLDLLEGPIRRAGVVARNEAPSDPMVCLGDRAQLRQVLLQILLNACQVLERHDQERTIRVGVIDHPPDLEIWVEDSGPGVPDEDAQSIFLPFISGYGGTGLGLPMARQTLIDMDGSLRLEESGLGGAAFVVSLRKATDG